MKYPQLTRVLGEAYPENWEAAGDRAEAVLQKLLRERSSEELRLMLRELDELLASGVCEPQLSDVVRYEIGCYVAPEAEGLDMSAWLVHVRDAVRRRVA